MVSSGPVMQRFYERLTDGIRAAAPRAEMVRLDAPPVLGAALLGLDALAGECRRAAR